MITDLTHLKIFLTIPAFTAGFSLFLFFYNAVILAAENIGRKKRPADVLRDDYSNEDADIGRYERIVRNETLHHTWYYSAIETVSLLVLTAAVLFHGRISDKAGLPLLIPLCLISSLTAVFSFFMKKRWESEACDGLISCLSLFTGAAHDLHTGIRMMLSVSGINIPMKTVLAEIQKDNPGISDRDLMLRAGHILRYEKILRKFSLLAATEEEKAETGHPEGLDAYNSGFAVFSFGIILLLCLLFNF